MENLADLGRSYDDLLVVGFPMEWTMAGMDYDFPFSWEWHILMVYIYGIYIYMVYMVYMATIIYPDLGLDRVHQIQNFSKDKAPGCTVLPQVAAGRRCDLTVAR